MIRRTEPTTSKSSAWEDEAMKLRPLNVFPPLPIALLPDSNAWLSSNMAVFEVSCILVINAQPLEKVKLADCKAQQGPA
jgi:hypothetical protein